MARIAGKEIPNHKQIWISLTYIYGIGRNTSLKILKATGIDPQKKTADLSDDDISKIRDYIKSLDVFKLKFSFCYRLILNELIC